MFGFSFAELVVVTVVALVVIGPKDLPKMLRKLGKWAGQLRRMAVDLRAQSGIDDALRAEGLADDIAEIRKLARGQLDDVQRAARLDDTRAAAAVAAALDTGDTRDHRYEDDDDDIYISREREYPREGADAYGALPEDAFVYAEGLAASALSRDPLYVLGDAEGVLPDPAPAPAPATSEAGAEALLTASHEETDASETRVSEAG